MSTWVTNVGNEKTTIDSDVTTKVSVNSISPLNVGGNMEAICDLLIALGWDGDESTIIQTLYKIRSGPSANTHTTISPTEIIIIDPSAVQAFIADNTGKAQFGNPAAGNVLIDPVAVGYNVIIGSDRVSVQHSSGNLVETRVIAGVPVVEFTDHTTLNLWTLSAGVLTANRAISTIDAAGSIPIVVAKGSALLQTAAVASVVAFTVPANDTYFEISCILNTTAYTSGGAVFNITFTDDNSTAHTIAVFTASGVSYRSIVIPILAKASSTITISTGFSGTSTYDVHAVIKQTS